MSNGRTVTEMTPLKEQASIDDLGSNTEIESWLESSSKFHSCEVGYSFDFSWQPFLQKYLCSFIYIE